MLSSHIGATKSDREIFPITHSRTAGGERYLGTCRLARTGLKRPLTDMSPLSAIACTVNSGEL